MLGWKLRIDLWMILVIVLVEAKPSLVAGVDAIIELDGGRVLVGHRGIIDLATPQKNWWKPLLSALRCRQPGESERHSEYRASRASWNSGSAAGNPQDAEMIESHRHRFLVRNRRDRDAMLAAVKPLFIVATQHEIIAFLICTKQDGIEVNPAPLNFKLPRKNRPSKASLKP